VQFKVTSHWDDGYRAAVTITDTGAVPLTGWHLTFHVTGATLHQPTDTGETAMAGDVVTVTPAAWRRPLAVGAQATFGMGFDGALAAPGRCLLDGAPCELRYVDAVAAAVPGQ
jgi:chitin-binding protein